MEKIVNVVRDVMSEANPAYGTSQQMRKAATYAV
jgi:hypothetical protein